MRTFVAAIALLVLALALRLPHGELAEWKGDEGVQFARARALAREGVLPARGLPTTDGPRLPVHFIWILAAPLVVHDSPEAVRVGIVLLASLVIVSVFLLGRRDLGAKTALAWALLLAVLPDEVRRGRWSWNPNLIPPLAALALLLLVRARRRPNGPAGAGLLAFATLLPLVHYSLVGLGAVSLVAGLAFTKDRRAFLAGSVLALLLLAPHVVIESRSGFKDTRAAFGVAGHKPDDPERAALAFPRLATRAFELENYARAAGSSPLVFEPAVSLATRALLALGVLLAVVSLARRRLEPPGLALLSALGAWAPFLVLGLPARHHYVQTAVPALAYLAAFAVTRARVLGLLLAPIGWASVLSVWAVLSAADRGLVGAGSDYDLPIGEKARACRELLARELEIVHRPRFEYMILLEACWRELPAAERERFVLEPRTQEYWDVSYSIPRPRSPRGRAAITVIGGKTLIVEVP